MSPDYHLSSPCFARLLVPKDVMHSSIPFVFWLGAWTRGSILLKVPPDSGSDLNASAKIISSHPMFLFSSSVVVGTLGSGE